MATGGGPRLTASLQLRQELRAVPGLLQAMALLPLAHHELEQVLGRALDANPMLQREPVRPCLSCGFPTARRRCGHCTSTTASTSAAYTRPTSPPEPFETPFETLESLAASEVGAPGRPVLALVIDHLTDRGLLDTTPEQIADDHQVALPAVLEAIRAIRTVGPAGITSLTVADLLAMQAQELVDTGLAPPWITSLIRDHLPLVAAGDLQALAVAAGVPPSEIGPVLALIRDRLRPFVTVDRASRSERAPSPDVFVYRAADGELTVHVIGSRDLGLDLAETEPDLRDHPEAGPWLAGHERLARQLIAQVNTRAATLHRVALETVRRQHAYFREGQAGQVDLTRTDIADALGLHPSTVSRTVAGKVLRRPDGHLIDLAELFGTGAAIRARLLELIATDGYTSDAQLAARLAAEGFSIARRTVTKYRAQLDLPIV